MRSCLACRLQLRRVEDHRLFFAPIFRRLFVRIVEDPSPSHNARGKPGRIVHVVLSSTSPLSLVLSPGSFYIPSDCLFVKLTRRQVESRIKLAYWFISSKCSV